MIVLPASFSQGPLWHESLVQVLYAMRKMEGREGEKEGNVSFTVFNKF